MINGLVAGVLVGEAEMRTGKIASQFVVAKVKAMGSDGDTTMVNVISFSAETIAALVQLDDGDAVALSGTLTPKVWTDKQGNTRPALDMVAHQALTAYHITQKQAALSDAPT